MDSCTRDDTLDSPHHRFRHLWRFHRRPLPRYHGQFAYLYDLFTRPYSADTEVDAHLS